MTDDLDILVRQYIDGELPAERESQVLHRIAEEAEARALLRFELQLRDGWVADAVEVPVGFTDRTMAAIETASASAPVSASAFGEAVEQVWHWLVAPKAFRVRPGVAMGALFVAVAALSLWSVPRLDAPGSAVGEGRPPLATTAAHNEVVWTRFMYTDGEASSVAVAGDFSGWEPISLSAKTVDGETVWTGVVPASKGEHQYMFVIDGSEWVTDPLAPSQRSDGFGNQNAVIHL